MKTVELRLLSRIEKTKCHFEILSGTKQFILLQFSNGQSRKLQVAELQGWLAKGLVQLNDTKISLTNEGRSALQRTRAGSDETITGYAIQHGACRSGPQDDWAYENANESPLKKLFALKTSNGKKWLEKLEFEAGERMRRDFEYSQMRQRITMSYDPTHVLQAKGNSSARNVQDELSTNAMSARDRLNSAIRYVGPELSGVLMDVCCFLKGLETVERERGWPRRSAKLVLKMALAALARHYFPEAKGRTKGSILSWGDVGYRPEWP